MLIADVNEYHPLVDGAAYAAGRAPDGTAYSVIILRATYGAAHQDNAYTSSLGQARAAGLVVGHYGYLTALADPTEQGAFFGQVVKANGGLKAGDSVWCDCEEGAGDQTARIDAFLAAAHRVLGDSPADGGVYSGAVFWSTHIGQLPAGTHRWVAAYGQAAAPAGAELWQFTDTRAMPGVAGLCDCSIYTGTLDGYLAAFGYQPAPVDPPAPLVPGPAIGDNMVRQSQPGCKVQIRQGWDNFINPPPGVPVGRVIDLMAVVAPDTPPFERKSYSGPMPGHPDGRINLRVDGVPDGIYDYVLTWIDPAAG